MNTLYRKVLCSERLPHDSNYYDTDNGYNYCWNEKWFDQDGPVNFTPEWWLEEVDIPTNEEIESRVLSELPNPEWGAAARLLWKSGFKKALEILTNEK